MENLYHMEEVNFVLLNEDSSTFLFKVELRMQKSLCMGCNFVNRNKQSSSPIYDPTFIGIVFKVGQPVPH